MGDGLVALQYTDVDLAAEGGYLKPLQKEFTVMPTGPNLVIELKPKVQHPILNGIEIYSREMDGEGALSRFSALWALTSLRHWGTWRHSLPQNSCHMKIALLEMMCTVVSHVPAGQTAV